MAAFDRLALRHGLLDRTGESPDGLPERYLYSADLVYRYAFVLRDELAHMSNGMWGPVARRCLR